MANGSLDFSKINDLNTFLKKFWADGSAGNVLIKELNKYAIENKKDFIRREKHSPCIYAVLNKHKPAGIKNYMLVKVGFTQKTIVRGTDNRMENVEKQINESPNGENATTLFVFRIGCTDTRPHSEIEKEVRNKVGKSVKKSKITELDLPIPTEWVLTTQGHIDKIKRLKDAHYEKKKPDAIYIFKDIKVPEITGMEDWIDQRK